MMKRRGFSYHYITCCISISYSSSTEQKRTSLPYVTTLLVMCISMFFGLPTGKDNIYIGPLKRAQATHSNESVYVGYWKMIAMVGINQSHDVYTFDAITTLHEIIYSIFMYNVHVLDVWRSAHVHIIQETISIFITTFVHEFEAFKVNLHVQQKRKNIWNVYDTKWSVKFTDGQ